MATWYAQDHERCYAGDLRPGLSMSRREFTNHSAATDWDEAPLGERGRDSIPRDVASVMIGSVARTDSLSGIFDVPLSAYEIPPVDILAGFDAVVQFSPHLL